MMKIEMIPASWRAEIVFPCTEAEWARMVAYYELTKKLTRPSTSAQSESIASASASPRETIVDNLSKDEETVLKMLHETEKDEEPSMLDECAMNGVGNLRPTIKECIREVLKREPGLSCNQIAVRAKMLNPDICKGSVKSQVYAMNRYGEITSNNAPYNNLYYPAV